MSPSLRVGALLGCLLLAPTLLYAQTQASITGSVKDTSGAVLPGVTVEASSPELIEKVRGAVTDATGQYRIENLRPGRYTVTFTLAGFSTVRREAIDIAGSATFARQRRAAGRDTRRDDHCDGRVADRRRADCATRICGLERRHHLTADGRWLLVDPVARAWNRGWLARHRHWPLCLHFQLAWRTPRRPRQRGRPVVARWPAHLGAAGKLVELLLGLEELAGDLGHGRRGTR